MPLIMLEDKRVNAADGTSRLIKKGEHVPKEFAEAWAGKPFVRDTEAKVKAK
jgi:hypothetical protein